MPIKNHKGKLGKFSYDDTEFVIKRAPELHLRYKGEETDGSKIKIPEGIVDCNHMFFDNKLLETPPIIPEGVKNCKYMFAYCENLIKAPEIPEGVENCGSMFGCTNLKTPPIIPEGVKDCECMFYNCTNLEILPEVPETIKNKKNMFTGCKKAINSIFL